MYNANATIPVLFFIIAVSYLHLLFYETAKKNNFHYIPGY